MESSRNSDVKNHFASKLTSHVKAPAAETVAITESALAEEKTLAIDSLPASATISESTAKA